MPLFLDKKSLSIFSRDHHVSLDITGTAIDDRPQPIQASFNIPFSTLDAALKWDDQTVFFFKGMDCLKYDLIKKSVAPGYPKKIVFEWRGIWPADLSDAIRIGNTVFFFRKTQYMSYDVQLGRADMGYPKPILDGWPGVWESLDGAEYLGQNKVLFLKENQVIQYDLIGGRADTGYPLNIYLYVQSYGPSNTLNTVDADMQAIRNYVLTVTAAQAKITTCYLSAMHSLRNVIQGVSSSEARPNTLRVVLKSGLTAAERLPVAGIKMTTETEFRPICDLIHSISNAIDKFTMTYQDLSGADWIDGVRLSIADVCMQDKSGENLQIRIEDKYRKTQGDSVGRFMTSIKNELTTIQTMEPPVVQKLELAMYTAWVNQNFTDDSIDDTGYLHIQFADDDTLLSATVRSPLGNKVAAALNGIMTQAGVTHLMELDVVKRVCKGESCVWVERDNTVRKNPTNTDTLVAFASDDAWQRITQFTH
ncbi:MAG: hypothetical protein HOO98_15525 [Nitrospira sp.]|nr:hypothetical protein [Nitrospira sp.]